MLACLLARLRVKHVENIQPEKVVVVSHSTKMLDILEGMCETECYPFFRLDGSTPSAKRTEMVRSFNTRWSEKFVFLLSSKAGGVGLNIVGASRLGM